MRTRELIKGLALLGLSGAWVYSALYYVGTLVGSVA
jgi:hypothetical protein